MGTKMGPSYANLFLGFIEEKIRKENDLKNWMNFVCNFHPSIQYTKDISTTSVTFLDINVQIKNNKILTQIHYKETDSHNYLRYDSFHPEPCKNSIPCCQLLRLRKLTTDDDQYEQDSNEMASYFQKQGYPTRLIQQAKAKVGKKSQQSLLQPQLKATQFRSLHHYLNFHLHLKQFSVRHPMHPVRQSVHWRDWTTPGR